MTDPTNQHRRPTLRDVAERAGVSFKTVSRVINEEGTVSTDLTDRVTQAIEELGYRPDHRARHLRQGGTKTGAVGFVLVDVANPFFSALLRGIEEVARAHDYLVFSGSTDGRPEREEELITAFLDRRVDGLIVVPTGETSLEPLVREQQRGTPIVFLDLEPVDSSFDVVRSDHYQGAVAATNHLLAHGHTDIAFFGDHGTISSAAERRRGFVDAMTGAGLDVPENRTVCRRQSTAAWTEFFRSYFSEEPTPTALFTGQNFITIGAAEALDQLGLRSTIAHIGFDDVELAALLRPAISVVPQAPRDLGRRAANALFRRIDGDTSPPRIDIVECAVTPRGTGELPPVTRRSHERIR